MKHTTEPGKWTIEALLEHFDRVLEERDARHQGEIDALRREIASEVAAARRETASGLAGQEKAVDAALAAAEKATDAAFAAAEKAVAKAENAQDDRLAAHNGLQQQLKERDEQTPSRKEVDQALGRITDKVSVLENWRSKATGVGAVLVLFSGLVGAAVVRALGG